MWRHGLSLRSGFHTFKHHAFSTVIKSRYTRCSLCVQGTIQPNQYAFACRNYAKVASVPETQEEKSTEPVLLTPDLDTIATKPFDSEETKDKITDSFDLLSNSNSTFAKISSSTGNIQEALKHMTIDKGNDDELDVDDSDDSGKKWTTEQEQLLSAEIEKGNALTIAEWEDLRSRALSGGSAFNEHNIDSSVIGICMSFKQLTTGLSYLEYLSSSGKEPNIASISKFFKLCFACSTEVDDTIKKVIVTAYDSLRNKYPTFDATTAESAIHGLAVTQRWREGIALLDEIRLTCSPNTPTYSALIKASFDNDDADVGWELMAKMLEDNRKPMLYVYEAWLQHCHRIAAGNVTTEQKLVEKLLQFFADNDVRLSEDTVKLIRLWFEYSAPFEANWDAEYTTVDARGMCKSCHRHLNSNALKDHEFDALRTAFMDKAVVGSNVFLKSTPEELAEYQEFVKKTAPYDIVIDGLNVSYSAGGAGKGNSRSYARMLQSVVQHFVQRSQKVLVLGRKHMHSWPRQYMDYVYENAEVFLAQNLSQDDPYLLYAAMFSGRGTCFISRDLMRSHAFLLKDPKIQSYFRRWQKQHQYQVLYVGENGNVRLRTPLKFDTSVQRGRNDTWHIPYDLDSTTQRAMALNPPFQWLCLSHYSDRQSGDYEGESRPRQEAKRYGDSYGNESKRYGDSYGKESKRYGDSYGNESNHPFRRNAPRKPFDDLSADGEQSSSSFGKRPPARKSMFDDTFSDDDEKSSSSFRRPANKTFDEMLSDDDLKSSSTFKPKRFPQRKRYDEDSDDDFVKPQRNRSNDRRPTRKSDDWD